MSAERWEIAWSKRAFEERALLNPAFCGELMARMIVEYARLSGTPLPLPVAFLILPLILPNEARAALPGRADRTLATWAAENSAIVAALPDRVMRFRPITREALLFLTLNRNIELSPIGLSVGNVPLKLSARLDVTTDDTEHLRRSAGMLGRWFAGQSSIATVMQTMGVRP